MKKWSVVALLLLALSVAGAKEDSEKLRSKSHHHSKPTKLRSKDTKSEAKKAIHAKTEKSVSKKKMHEPTSTQKDKEDEEDKEDHKDKSDADVDVSATNTTARMTWMSFQM